MLKIFDEKRVFIAAAYGRFQAQLAAVFSSDTATFSVQKLLLSNLQSSHTLNVILWVPNTFAFFLFQGQS